MMISGYKKRKNTEAQIKRILIYSAILFLLSVAESSFFSSIKILPATPDLILGAITIIALTDTRETTVIAAIIGGVMSDAICGSGIYLSPLFYLAVALLLCPFAKKLMRSYLSWLALFPVALIMRAIYTTGRAYLFYNGFDILEVLQYAVLPEAICTAVFSLLLYPIVTGLARIVKSRRDMS